MMTPSLLFVLLIASTKGYSRTCSGGLECKGTTVNCIDDGGTCSITCQSSGTDGGCEGTTINCVDGYLCQVIVGGQKSARQAIINGNGATKLEITTQATGQWQLQEANITCPVGGDCFIHCKKEAYQICHSMWVNAELSKDLVINCEDANEACNSVDVWCPRDNIVNSCTLDGQLSTSSMWQMIIHSQNGFNTMEIINGNTATSIGTMYCLSNYSASCTIDANPAVKASQMACLNGPHICDNPPPPTTTTTTDPTIDPTIDPTMDPTTDPTIDPTMDPTTNPTTEPTTEPTVEPTIYPSTDPTIDPTIDPTTAIPTTSMPTTAQPTTSSPSTSTPTTAIPTTAQPTTSSPSTFNPTTTSPTTHNPTTIAPTTATPTTPPPTPKQATNNYTITIEGKDANNLNEEEIEAIIINSLNISSDNILSTKTDHGLITILISIPSDISLDEDIIKEYVEEGLVKEYGDDLDITITVDNPNDNKSDTTKHPLSFITDDITTLILSIIGIILVIICIILCIMVCRKKKGAKKALNDQDALSKSVAITTTSRPATDSKTNGNDERRIEMQTVTDTDGGYREVDTTMNEIEREEIMDGDTTRERGITYTIPDTNSLPAFKDDIDSDSNDDMYNDENELQTTNGRGGGRENDDIEDRSDTDDGNDDLYHKGSGKTPMKQKQDTNNNDDDR